jgi:O-antigen ligase
VTVGSAGSRADIATASLLAPDGAELLDNREFADGLAHWFPIAQTHFLPWHIDNLYLELLIERGAPALAMFLLLLVCGLLNLLLSHRQGLEIAPFVAASLFGTLLVGTVSSVVDVPRVAFLLLLMLAISLQVGRRDCSA